MRWLFFLMVAVNVAILVWGVQRKTETSTELDPRYRNIGEIKLLSKADIAAQALAHAPGKERMDGVMPAPEQQLGSEEANAATSLDTAVKETDPEPELPVQQETMAAVREISSEAADDSAAIISPPDESTDTSMQASSQFQSEESEIPEAEIAALPEVRCWSLGPIDQRPDALVMLDAIRKEAASAGLREEIERETTGFWVVLPPYENASAAIAVVNQLKARDISDVQRFYKGELQNGVSLGIYNQRFNAEKRREQIETKGFSPEVIPRYREELRYWVDYSSEIAVDTSVDIPSRYRNLAASERECATPLN